MDHNNDNFQPSNLQRPTKGFQIAGENENLRQVMQSVSNKDDEYLMSLPAGYRFVPTDAELIGYLRMKLNNQPLPPNIIRSVKLSDYSPEQLSVMYPLSREQAWYFFTPINRKYPKGSRPSRNVFGGYWKPTATSKIVWTNGQEIGYKRQLDFYAGTHADGKKTNWKMHEYTLGQPENNSQGAGSSSTSGGSKQLYGSVLCKIYKKAESNKNEDDVNALNDTIPYEHVAPNVAIGHLDYGVQLDQSNGVDHQFVPEHNHNVAISTSHNHNVATFMSGSENAQHGLLEGPYTSNVRFEEPQNDIRWNNVANSSLSPSHMLSGGSPLYENDFQYEIASLVASFVDNPPESYEVLLDHTSQHDLQSKAPTK